MEKSKADKILSGIELTALVDLKLNIFKSAIRYARIRTDWYFLNKEERMSSDSARTMAHNSFIDDCNILSRNMTKANEDISWRAELGSDRKIIGDFACYLHCILGIKSR